MANGKYLVTGGAGFIGSHMVEKLLEMGHDVVCLDNFDHYYDVSVKEQNIARFMADPAFTLVRGSILDLAALKRSLDGVDHVFHFAARAGIRESLINPLSAHEVNATGTLMVLKEARDAGVKKVVFSSSSSVYGDAAPLPFSEEGPTIPISPYGVSKLCAENYCEVYRKIHGLDTAVLRYFTVYGPRMRPDLAISIFTRKALEGHSIDILGDGTKSRDFTYIEDVVEVSLKAMEQGSGAYNIGSGKAITIGLLARMIIDYTGSKSVIRYREDVQADMGHTLADIARAKRDLGYRPQTGIAEGLRRYVEAAKTY